MCFSPQRRAFFRHQNVKNCSEHVMFCTCSLPNVLFATAAYNFSTSEREKVLRNWRVLYTFASKCAFRHSGVQFLISPLSTYLRTRRFNRPKNTAFRDFSNIWRGCIFFLLTFALLHLLSADLTTLLCFSTVHIVGSFYLNFLRLYILLVIWYFIPKEDSQNKSKGFQGAKLKPSSPTLFYFVPCCLVQCRPPSFSSILATASTPQAETQIP